MCGDYSLEDYEPRITPACAGTTAINKKQIATLKNHPRLCGDYRIRRREIVYILGSPLHIRGLLSLIYILI